MDYRLETKTNGRCYLCIVFHGRWTETNGLDVLQSFYELIRAQHKRKVLIDFRGAEYLQSDVLIEYHEAQRAAEYPDADQYWFAAVFKARDFINHLTWENFASHLGLHLYAFTRESDAVQWLMDDCPCASHAENCPICQRPPPVNNTNYRRRKTDQ